MKHIRVKITDEDYGYLMALAYELGYDTPAGAVREIIQSAIYEYSAEVNGIDVEPEAICRLGGYSAN